MADDERDAILDRLLQIPENKVNINYQYIISNRFALIARARIQNGHLLTLESFCVTSVLQCIETSEFTFHSSGISYLKLTALTDRLKWTGGRRRNLNAWNSAVTRMLLFTLRKTECFRTASRITKLHSFPNTNKTLRKKLNKFWEQWLQAIRLR